MMSIYEKIHEAILASGELPKEFSVQSRRKDGIAFADGAQDGIFCYHFGGEVPKNPALEHALLAAAEKDYDRAESLLRQVFADENTSMISQSDHLVQWVRDNYETVNVKAMYCFARHLLFASEDVESVKCALSIMEYIIAENDEECKAAIRELGLSDEFALFVIYVILRWRNAHEEIFRLAQKLHGWGRIHAVAMLETQTQEIKDWLLHEGIDNEVMPEYSALTVANKVDLLGIVRESDAGSPEFLAAGKILQALIWSDEGGPVTGISGYEQGEALVQTFLAKAAESPNGGVMGEMLQTVREYAGKLAETYTRRR